MKLTFAVIFLSAAIVMVSAEAGQYVPKGFYTIDEEGNESPMSYLKEAHEDKILHRLKRSPAFVTSSSSSSSFNSANGGPVFFQQSGSFVQAPGFGRRPKGSYVASSGYIDKYGRPHYNKYYGAV